MRTHTQIVRDYGVSRLAKDLADDHVPVKYASVARWAERNSIPGTYWHPIAALKAATFEELAQGADKRTRQVA